MSLVETAFGETPHYAAVNLVFVVFWLALWVIAHEHRKLTADDTNELAA